MKERAAIVTGAGKGIGEAAALRLGEMGAAVCCNSLSDSAAQTADRIRAAGGRAIFVGGDVACEEIAGRIVSETAAAFGGIDILVNNAGVVLPGTPESTTAADWDQTMAVNVRSVFLLSRAALPYLSARKGVIVNISSSVALKGVKDRLAYTASKGAVLAMTRAMAADLINRGVRVNCICPGTTWTPSLDSRLAKFPDPGAKKQEFIARQPMGRFGTPEEIAEGIIYLIDASFCTGAALAIDGGMTM
jgi:NAD(P)-dependent dehydrogenase (short-subunit alcohol dehydrogenase family)